MHIILCTLKQLIKTIVDGHTPDRQPDNMTDKQTYILYARFFVDTLFVMDKIYDVKRPAYGQSVQQIVQIHQPYSARHSYKELGCPTSLKGS